MAFNPVAFLRELAQDKSDVDATAFTECADRIEELEAENANQADALHKIQQWADAYPTGVFGEVTKEELTEANEKLGAELMTRMHGSWARHIFSGMKDIARRALGDMGEKND